MYIPVERGKCCECMYLIYRPEQGPCWMGMATGMHITLQNRLEHGDIQHHTPELNYKLIGFFTILSSYVYRYIRDPSFRVTDRTKD